MAMSSGDPSFAAFLGRRIRKDRHVLAARWLERLDEPSSVEPGGGTPEEQLLKHVRVVLERIADYVANPEDESLETLDLRDLIRIAELRRRQGVGLQNLLLDLHHLSELVRNTAEAAVKECPGRPEQIEVARSIGNLMDAMKFLSTTTAQSFHTWKQRYEEERDELLEAYGEIISHELGNRLGAAETAVRLLLSPSSLSEKRRARLAQMILEGIREGKQTVKDLAALARPYSPDRENWAPLRLIVKESVRLSGNEADRHGIPISLVGDVPDVRVPAPPVRVALANLLSNAVRYHRDSGQDRWVRVSTRLDEESSTVDIAVEDNGPGIPDAEAQDVFEFRFRGRVSRDGSGLGLAITREMLHRAEGSISLRRGSESGALFIVSVPATGFDKTPRPSDGPDFQTPRRRTLTSRNSRRKKTESTSSRRGTGAHEAG